MTGVVLRVVQEDEGGVMAGAPLLEVGDPASVEVITDVLSEDAAQLHAGASARVIVSGGDTLAGVVRQIEPTAFTKRSSLGVDEQRVRVVIGLTTLFARGAPLGDGYRVDVATIGVRPRRMRSWCRPERWYGMPPPGPSTGTTTGGRLSQPSGSVCATTCRQRSWVASSSAIA